MSSAIHVLIVEDETLLRTGLKLIIQEETDMHVIGTAENGLAALELLKGTRPDIVLLDLEMPVMNGLECIREIRKRDLELPILILSSYYDDEYIFQGLAYGANGYLLKDARFDTLAQTIREVLNDQFVLSEVGKQIAQYVLKNNNFMMEHGVHQYFEQNKQYSEQEKEITMLLLAGLRNRDIADQLHFTEGTIKNKLTVIYEKLGVNNRLEAVRFLKKCAIKGRSS